MQLLQQFSAEYNIPLNRTQLAQFERYQALLIEWNQRMNLTRIIEPQAIVVRHFLDSLTCQSVTGDLNGQSLIDVGTGAGFPGLPLKILFPQLQLTLTDSVAKKTHFLQAVVDELKLTEVTVLAKRAETLGQDAAHREQYDWAVGRSVAHLRVLSEYLLPLAKVSGAMLAMKGGAAMKESAEAQNAITLLGGAHPTLTTVSLPERDTPHYLLLSRKVAPTPAKYPRRVGKPSKRPL